MKKLIKHFPAIFLCLIAVSCSKDFLVEKPVKMTERSFVVQLSDAADTKALLEDGVRPVWEVGEKVSVYDPVASTSCSFTVQSVSDGFAVITGSISEGDFPFSAVYPESAVDTWTDINTVSFSIPSAQVIENGRVVDGGSLVSRAYAATYSESIVFRNQVSLLKFRVEKNDIACVSISLNKEGSAAKNYSVSGTFEKGKYYYAAVLPDSYDGGISVSCSTPFGERWTRTSTNAIETKLNNIKSLGDVSDGTKSIDYTIEGQRTLGNLDAFLDSTGILESLDKTTLAIINLLKPTVFPWQSEKLLAYIFHHKSVDPDGQPVTLSAIVYIPEKAVTKGTKLKGVVIAYHGSIASNAQRPTNSDDYELIAAWKGYAVVLSDYCGFGADVAHPQAYLNPDVTAHGSINAYLAACQFMKDNGISYGTDLYNIGYSQGGFNGMANIKYVSEHPDLGIKFTKSFLGGGPYDPYAVWHDYLSGNYPNATSFAPITITSINECEHLGIPYDKLFQEPLLSNYQEWILSKKYDRGKINNFIGTKIISEMVTPEVIQEDSPVHLAITDVCERYKLVSGWKPAAGNVIHIYHSNQDDIVPYSSFESIKEHLSAVAGDSTIKYLDGNDGGHSDAIKQWAINMATNW